MNTSDIQAPESSATVSSVSNDASTATTTRTTTEPIPYQYFVLRAVPRPERGECVNVAVVLYSEELDHLALGWDVDEPRLRAIDPAIDLDSVRDSLAFLSAWCDTPSQTFGRTATPSASQVSGGPVPQGRRPGARFGWLAATRSTILRPGPVHGGVSPDPRGELDRLVTRLVRPLEVTHEPG